jgi:peptide deformylase
MEVLVHPNPALKQGAAPVDANADQDLHELVVTMARLMYGEQGLGLAATQIGVLKRVIIYDLSEDRTELVALCNPMIVERSDEVETLEEGCLSLPGIGVPVERALRVTCVAETLSGKPVSIDAEGLYARMLQHETDHLDGVLIIDRASPDERRAALVRYREANDAGARTDQ